MANREPIFLSPEQMIIQESKKLQINSEKYGQRLGKENERKIDIKIASELIKSDEKSRDELILELANVDYSAFNLPNKPNLKSAREKYNNLDNTIIAIIEGKIEGYVWYDIIHDKADIHELVTSANAQRRGIGTSLMDELIEILKRQGVKIAELVSTTEQDDEHPSKPFYDKYFLRRKGRTGLQWKQDGPSDKRFTLDLESEKTEEKANDEIS